MSQEHKPKEAPKTIKDGFEEIGSSIPPHLIKDAPDPERYMLETVSILEQRSNHLNENDKRLDEAVGTLIEKTDKTDARVEELEEIKKKVATGGKSIWILILAIGGLLAFIFKALEFSKGLFK